jgi:formamidopyrimidine-DNA glycosylase
MPELPEVETIRQDLRRKILHKKITDVQILHPKVVGDKPALVIKQLIGKNFSEIGRVGKLLIGELSDDNSHLLIHLKMTGQLIYRLGDKIYAGGHSLSRIQTELPDKHTQVIITFADDSKLYFNDQRRFGYVRIAGPDELQAIKATYGLEPLTPAWTFEAFQKQVQGRKTLLKAFLLNQNLIAGIGNIYADEIAHNAGILPTRRLNKLSNKELRNIFLSSEKILSTAIKFRGTTFNNYVDSDGNTGNFTHHLRVYERAGKHCLRCQKGIIKKIRAAGRGTYFCPHCQI